MPFNSPIFIDHNKTYKADTCTPLKNAAKEGLINFIGVKRGLYPGMELPENHLPGINSIGIWDITEPQDWGLDWHRNEGIELTFLENGTLPFEVTSNRKHLLEPNDLTITRPWQTHRVGVPNVGVSRLYWIILDVGVRRPHQEWKWPNWIILSDDDLQHLTHMMRKNEEPVWHTSTDILHCFHSIGKSLAQVIEGGSPSKLGIHINELFLLIYEMFQYRKIPLNRSLTSTIRNVELFLNEIGHNLSEPWTLETMSEACGVGITRFVHYCIKIKNMTPMQYLNKIRLEKAAELLGHGRNEKILDIALQCGFNSSQYFSTIFKQHFHETPSGYKKNLNAVIS